MAELFGCCSLNEECSDAMQCLRLNDPEYSNCGYRRNLEAGRIFYGKNATKEPEIVIETPKNVIEFSETVLERYRKHEIYLVCMNKQYTVKFLIKDFSYGLSRDQAKKLSNLFKNLEIPFSTECAEPEKTELTEVCNSRVIITVGDEKFRIAAWNDYLIPSSESKKIARAFKVKGIDSGVETYATRPFSIEATPKPSNIVLVQVKQPEPVLEQKEVVYQQISLFG